MNTVNLKRKTKKKFFKRFLGRTTSGQDRIGKFLKTPGIFIVL